MDVKVNEDTMSIDSTNSMLSESIDHSKVFQAACKEWSYEISEEQKKAGKRGLKH